MEEVRKSLASRFLLFIAPLVKFIDIKLSVPYYKKKVHGGHYFLWRDRIDEGTVFLTNTLGPGSNLINPSDINHSAIYFGKGLRTYLETLMEAHKENLELVGRWKKIIKDYDVRDDIRYVIEAVGQGVVPTDLVSFLTTKDLVIGKKATFCSSDLSMDASRVAVYDLGKKYDYSFSHAEDTKYCFEVCADAFENTVQGKRLKRVEYKIFGFKVHDTFLSDTFQTSDWETVFDSENVKDKHLG